MAKVTSRSGSTEYVITLNEDEALYLFSALRFTNPPDDRWDVTGGDPVYSLLGSALTERGIDVENIDHTEYAEVI